MSKPTAQMDQTALFYCIATTLHEILQELTKARAALERMDRGVEEALKSEKEVGP